METIKKCKYCFIDKSESLFHFNTDRDYYENICESCWRKKRKEYNTANLERNNAYKNKYKNENLEKVIEAKRKWKEENIGKVKADHALSKKRIKQATPKWLTLEQHKEIEDIYETAHKLTKETGISHHVDHKFPIRGKTVSGLHVPWNLQILTARENLIKSNKLPEMEIP